MKLIKKKNIYFLGFFFFFSLFLFSQEVSSESFSEIATQLKVDDSKAQPGDIISEKNGELIRSSSAYDENIFGVISSNPIIIVGRDISGSLPITTFGIALVKVNGDYDEIKKGDFITSSNTAGVGRKALYPGFVVGRAMEDFNGGEGIIEVLVNPHEAIIKEEKPWEKVSFWELIGRILRAIEKDIPQVLRYLLAALFVGGSFIFGLKSFSRTLKDGIMGISRNPLAKGSIRFAMILNLIGILILTMAGLTLALFIIIL